MEHFSSSMLAIMEQTDNMHDCYMDNTRQFILLMLFKVFLNGGALYLCCFKPLWSFFNICSISFALVDLSMTAFMTTTLWMDVQSSHVAMCYIMANFSAAYSALPVPVLCLGILDYYLEDTCAGRKYIRLTRNIVLVILMWLFAGCYALETANATLLSQTRNIRYVVCEIKESRTVGYFTVALTAVMCIALLPYMTLIPKWVKEAERISEEREEIAEARIRDLKIDMTTEEDTKFPIKEFTMPRPPMHLSLLICFGVFWMPYLAVTTICVTLEFGIPAYISVNLLWVQCVNSLLEGVVFWLRSGTVGTYISQYENICLWQAYWDLSADTNDEQLLPVHKFNPSNAKRDMAFYV
ncbi:probable G-protein coupled receptor 160 [Periophthalmus magnuspinnatus]|uniref:probable G-protein coupled receptor 160 n=1 Tax=Periophthalmus magnuspinnatus TaxID=409849 RepID=UPI00145B4600|nr:probable G-protein coupled receptor 160 [Periophthalmus magnuspinnatus]